MSNIVEIQSPVDDNGGFIEVMIVVSEIESVSCYPEEGNYRGNNGIVTMKSGYKWAIRHSDYFGLCKIVRDHHKGLR